MKKICIHLRRDILRVSRRKGIDPYKEEFRPRTFRLNANEYGSFSDHCIKGQTKSSENCGCGTLTCVRKDKSRYDRTYYYLLIKKIK